MFMFILNLINKILSKLVSTFLKESVVKKLDKYIFDPELLFIDFQVINKNIYINIYDIELILPIYNSIKILRFDIYKLIIIIPLKLKRINIICNGINIIYKFKDSNTNISNIFFENSNEDNDSENKNDNCYEETNLSINILESWVDKIIKNINFKIYNIKAIDIVYKSTIKISSLRFKQNTEIIKINNLVFFINKHKICYV